MAKIALDCDGVLANFLDSFAKEVNHLFPGRIQHPDGYWKTHTQWNWPEELLSKKEVTQVWDRIKATPNWWMTLGAHSDSVGALAVFFWTQRAQDVYICTARTPTVGQTVAFQTDTWIRACGVQPIQNYLAVIPAEGDDKPDVYAYAGIEFSIDDKKETVEQCDAHPLLIKQKHQAFLLDRPWNQDAKVKRRVKTVEEFLEAVKKKYVM